MFNTGEQCHVHCRPKAIHLVGKIDDICYTEGRLHQRGSALNLVQEEVQDKWSSDKISESLWNLNCFEITCNFLNFEPKSCNVTSMA